MSLFRIKESKITAIHHIQSFIHPGNNPNFPMALNQEFWMQQKRREAHKSRQHFAGKIWQLIG